jgi:hypothetical protein
MAGPKVRLAVVVVVVVVVVANASEGGVTTRRLTAFAPICCPRLHPITRNSLLPTGSVEATTKSSSR